MKMKLKIGTEEISPDVWGIRVEGTPEFEGLRTVGSREQADAKLDEITKAVSHALLGTVLKFPGTSFTVENCRGKDVEKLERKSPPRAESG